MGWSCKFAKPTKKCLVRHIGPNHHLPLTQGEEVKIYKMNKKTADKLLDTSMGMTFYNEFPMTTLMITPPPPKCNAALFGDFPNFCDHN